MKAKIIFFYFLIRLLISTCITQAQWVQTNGPDGGGINCFAVSGTSLYAGTYGGIFRSTNNGTSWAAVNTGLSNIYVTSLVVSGTNLFAGTSLGSIFLSTNNGTSWSIVKTGGTSITDDVNALAVSGTNLFAGTYGGIFRSTNNGTTWTAVNTGLSVTSLAVSGTKLFAGGSGGVFLSTNNGASWTAVNTGLTNTNVRTLVVSGSNLIAGTFGGVFLSTDNGASWIAVNTGLTSTYVMALSVSGTNLFAGTWTGGVFRSTNNGANWTAINTGLISTYVSALAVSGTNLFAGTGTDGGVFLSTNNGTSWVAVNTGLTNTNVKALVVSGTNLFAGTNGGGAFLSTNNGASWKVINAGLTNYVYALAISGTNLFAGCDYGVFLSTDNGASWSRTGLYFVKAFAFSGTNIFAVGDNGVFLSTNNGTSWTAVNTGLLNTSVTSIVVNGANLFVGTSGGIFRSTNNGTSWAAVNTGLSNIYVTSLVVNGANILAGTIDGIYLSTNNGTSWSAVNTGLTNTNVRALAISGGSLFAGTFNGGIFLSTNNGTSWTAINTGLTYLSVNSIAVSSTNLFVGTTTGGVWRRPLDEMIPTVVIRTPTISISSSVISNNGSLQITGNNFTPTGTVNLSFTGPSGVAIPTATITADANGKIAYTFIANPNMQPGYYYVVATDVTTNKLTSTQKFQIISEPENYKLTLNSPKQGAQFSSGDNLTVAWADKMVLSSNYSIDVAKRKYSYKIELSTDGGSTWKEVTTLAGKEEVNKVVSFSKNILLTEVGGNNKIRVTDLYKNSNYVVSGAFSVIAPQSLDVKASLVWDYSFPERNGEPIGVACDGVARVYLKVHSINTTSTDNVKEVKISLSDDDNNTEARILGKLQIASTIDSYSEEANNASALTITNSNPAPDHAFYFWYVAPDEFCGKNTQDTMALDRTVNAKITITYQSGKIENILKGIKIVRPPLLLAHGLGGSPSTWDAFSYWNNGKYKRYLDDDRFLVRKALDLDWRGKFWNNARGVLLGHGNPNSFYVNIQKLREQQYASNQVIYIGHSMGGNVIREAINIGMNKNENYNKGFLNKAITLDTPYLGSPFADLIYDLIEKIKANDRYQVMSSIINNFLNYDSRSLPNSLCTQIPSGNSLISASGACEDLRVNSGVKYGRTDLPFHLVAADIVPGDQNLPEIPSYVFQLFNYADDFFDFFDKIISIVDVLGSQATSQYIKEISGLNKIERVIKFCEYMMKAYEGAAFLVDSDVIVSVKSQLSTLPRNSNNASVFSPNVWHLNVTQNYDVGNRVNTLLNGNNGQYFGGIPGSLSKSNLPSFSLFSSNTLKSDVIKNNNSITINSPTLNTVVAVDSTFNVSFSISDTSSLSYVRLYFQNQVYSSNNVSNQYSFSIQANGNLIDTQKVEVIATFSNQSSPYLLYDYVNIIVNTNTRPNSFRASDKTVYLMRNQPYNLFYTATFPKFISQISNKSPYLSVAVSNQQILQYDNQNKMFKSLAGGETSAIITYRGVADTVYFVVDTTDYLTTVTEDNYASNKTIIPTEYLLEQNYPNPFNPNTTISYSIPLTSLVSIKIYDILGREVVQLINEEKKPGKYQVTFNASKLSSGVYFYRLLAGSFVETKKLILVK